jgi:hypothetical protein
MAGTAGDLHEGEGGVSIIRFTTDIPTFEFVCHWLLAPPNWVTALKESIPEAAYIEKYVNARLGCELSHDSLLELRKILAQYLDLSFSDLLKVSAADAVKALENMPCVTVNFLSRYRPRRRNRPQNG